MKNNTLFKMEHPYNLCSRMFILEYLKDLGPNVVKEKLTEGEHRFWLYKFEGENNVIEYDFNWEYLLFVIPLENLGTIAGRYEKEIEEIEKARESRYQARIKQVEEGERKAPASISLYDMAQAEIAKDQDTSQLTL